MSRILIADMLSSPDSLDGYLRVLDEWLERLRRNEDVYTLTSVLYSKVILLEGSGRLAEARAVCQEALETSDRSKLTVMSLATREAMARLELRVGQPGLALESLRQAAEVGARLSPAAHRYALYEYGCYQRQQGQLAEALASFQRAAELVPNRAGPAYFGRALCFEGLGEYPKALLELEAARSVTDPEHKRLSTAALDAFEGRLLLRLGRFEEALPLLRRSHALLTEVGGERRAVVDVNVSYAEALLASGHTEQALAVAEDGLDRLLARPGESVSSLRPLLEKVVTLSLSAGRHEEALRYLELSRSAELVASVNLSDLRPEDPATATLVASLHDLRGRLEALQSEVGVSDDPDQRDGLGRVLAATRAEFFAKLDQLKRQEPDFESLVQLSGSDLSVIQSRLAADELLLEYYPSEDALYIFAVTADGFRLHQVNLGREALSRAVQGYVAMVRDSESDLARLSASSQRLYGLLLEPVLVEEKRRLRLVPAGPLWHIPFEALQDSERRSLDERYEVGYLTSADVLRTFADPVLSMRSPLLVGAVDADDLPGTSAEIAALSRLLPASRSLVGKAATSQALRRMAGDSTLLHIATHSGLGRSPNESYVGLSDGPFSLEQVYGLSLQPGTLVVLSSCQSALGETAPGREVTSLASAFNVAGAATVIASHWEVDDTETTKLFESFYKHLLAGQSRGQALRSARREMAAGHPHPYYWAAFSLFGSPL